MEFIIWPIASILQKYLFAKIEDKNIKKLVAVGLCTAWVLLYNWLMTNNSVDLKWYITAIVTAYWNWQIIYNIFFNK